MNKQKDEILAASETDAPSEQDGPLDGSTSGTIGGGGRETGGPTAHLNTPAAPPPNPDDIASGRLSPDPLAAAKQPPDPLKPGASSVTRH
jgi:hypothetical protein